MVGEVSECGEEGELDKGREERTIRLLTTICKTFALVLVLP